MSTHPTSLEINTTPDIQLQPKTWRKEIANFFMHLVLAGEKLNAPIQPTPVRSAHSTWDACNLAKRFAQPEYASEKSQIEALRSDRDRFAREYFLDQAVDRFTYRISLDTETVLGAGYSESLSVLLSNFTSMLIADGRPLQRSMVEQITINSVFEYFRSLSKEMLKKGDMSKAVGAGVVLVSPPDTVENGYGGITSAKNWSLPEENHSFFYLLELGTVSDTECSVHVTQYRMWPNMQQIIDVYAQLGTPITPTSDPITHQFFAHPIVVNTDLLKKILPPVDVGPSDPGENELQSLLRQVLYEQSSEHLHNFLEQPTLDEAAFWTYEQSIFEGFYLKRVIPLFDTASHLIKYGMEQSPQFAECTEELDAVFTWYTTAVGRWVRIHNTNPRYQPDASNSIQARSKIFKKNITHALNKLLQKNAVDTTENLELLECSKLNQTFDIAEAVKKKRSVSASDIQLLNSTVDLFGNISGKVQCGTTAALKLPLQLLMNSSPLDSFGGFNHALSLMSAPEQKKMYSEILSQDYVELDLTAQGANRVYMVPKSYLLGAGCTVDVATGRVWGPCGPDNARIYLDDPIDTMAYSMNKASFLDFTERLKKTIADSELTEISNIAANATEGITQSKVEQTIRVLQKYLFKHVVSIIEWIAGDYIRTQASQQKWLSELKEKLRFSSHPFALLHAEIGQLLAHEPELLHELHDPLLTHSHHLAV